MPASTSPEHVAAVQQLWYGHGHVPTRSDLEYSWKAVKALAAADGVLSAAERLHLLGKMCAVLAPGDVVEVVMGFDERSLAPHQLLAHIDVPPEQRPGTGAWITYEGLSVAMADGELAPGELAAIRRSAAVMGVAPTTVDALLEQCRAEVAVRAERIRLLDAATRTEAGFRGGAPPGDEIAATLRS